MVLALKNHLTLLKRSYEDSQLAEPEKEFLNSEGVAIPPLQGVLKARIPPFNEEKLVDIWFMVNCSCFMINNLLLANWNTPELKQNLLINQTVFWPNYNPNREDYYGLIALQKAVASISEKKPTCKCWYY
ncbi:hypothetical protein L596_026343 [Steinernema carpocapsae]|uniref:Uncharacterized protein n=1 Tax=Steinernema carpocapsae TaxID=34508 RepID=A0A4U5M127_STECR|nr:hypothetical protein L596_026343 [Steinernema carpocapsae]